MHNGGLQFEVACQRCGMRVLVDRIRHAEAAIMVNHLRERHPELGLALTAAMGEVFEYYRVTPTQR